MTILNQFQLNQQKLIVHHYLIIFWNKTDDGDGTPDYLDTDDDGDGLATKTEGLKDTDNDGIPDYPSWYNRPGWW